MNILFINPPRYNELLGKNPSIIEEHRGYNPPLGLLSLASIIRERRGDAHTVSILDCQPSDMSYDELGDVLCKGKYDLIGITTMTFTLLDVVRTLEEIEKRSPDSMVMLGGPHVHIFPEETLNLPGVDYLLQGEGEYSILMFLDALENKTPLSEVPGLVYREGDQIVDNGVAAKIVDLDEIPWPDRTLLPIGDYSSVIGKNNIVSTMFSSRGCPFKCRFCDRPTSPVNCGFRYRSAKNVVDEIEQCVELGINEILIYDDTFTVNKGRVLAICEEILARGIEVTWDVRAHVETIDPDMLKMMKRAGCERIHYGVECGNDRMMKVINKLTTIETVKRVFSETRKAGIESLAYFMIGLPTETIEDIQDTMKLAVDLNPDYAHITVFCPYPGTYMYEMGLEKGIIKKDVWKEFAAAPTSEFVLPVWEENFTREELHEQIVKFYKKFYMRPGYVLKRTLKVKSFAEFKRKFKAGMSVLKMKARNVARRG